MISYIKNKTALVSDWIGIGRSSEFAVSVLKKVLFLFGSVFSVMLQLATSYVMKLISFSYQCVKSNLK